MAQVERLYMRVSEVNATHRNDFLSNTIGGDETNLERLPGLGGESSEGSTKHGVG